MLSAVLICTCALVVHTEAQAPPGTTELRTANAVPAPAAPAAERAVLPAKIDEDDEAAKLEALQLQEGMTIEELAKLYGVDFPATDVQRTWNTLDLSAMHGGGETCATATPITSLPFSDVGDTAGAVNDYDEACPFTGSTAPDQVYSYTPTVDVTVDITLGKGSLYDTKLYVYENTCPGTVVASNDDACPNYVSAVQGVNMTAGNTYYIIVDGFGTASGVYAIDVTEATPGARQTQCPSDAIFGQDPHLPTESWSFATSDAGSTQDYLVYDNFTGLTSQICDIHFWGLDLMFTGTSWVECTEDPATFEVKFYTDAGGVPGTEVCSYTISASPVPTGLIYAGAYEMAEYSADLLPCCTLSDGWVSVQGTGGDPACWLLWASSGNGLDGHSYQWDGTALTDRLYDQAFCLTGVYVPVFGACCDDATATCTDNVEVINCAPPLRFAANTLCADLVPACGADPTGACCDPTTGTCHPDKTEAECIAAFGPGNWYEGVPCVPNPCPPPAPPNDQCANATPIGDVTDLPFDTTTATTDGIDTHAINQDIWYCYTASCSGLATFDLCGSGFDTKIAVYDGCDCAQVPGSELAYNDDSGPACTGLQSSVAVVVTAGNQYLVQVGGYGSNSGTGDLTISCQSEGDCCPTTVSTYPHVQDFEAGLGDWVNAMLDDIDWTWDSGGTPSSGTGPSGDHTTGSGYYAYTESSSSGYPNKTAILNSPCFDLSPLTTPEITFWYHMYGATMGELNVEVSDDDCATWTTLWTLAGDQGNQWFPGLIDLSAYSGTIKIRFRGVTGTSYTSDMAIDDIAVMESGGPVPGACCFDDGTCQELSSGDCAAAGGNFLGAFTTCTPNPCPQPCTDNCEDTFPYVEDFDSWSTCSTSCGSPCEVPAPWENDDTDDIDWTTDANGTPSSSTGPSGDHTTGSGNYMYVESSSGCYDSTAILVGPCVDLTGLANPALYFWYHMYGSSMGSLYVEVTTDDTLECVNWTTVWSLSGDQGNNWYPAVIDLSAYGSESLRFRFRGVTSDYFYGDMAIDDVMVDEGPAVGACCTGDACVDTFEMSCDGLFAGDNTLCDGTGGSDCNGNGVIDDCDLYNETSTDCNENGIPDECEGLPDCDGDGTPDICDPDCQPNGVSDVCEVLFGSSLDCQGDGIPDECQLGDSADSDVIYDNGPLITNPGAGAGGADVSALQTAIGGNIYGYGAQVSAGNRIADDVTFEGAAQIDTITFFAYQTGSTTTSTITGVTLRIWDGPPNAGGSVIWGDETTNVMVETDWSGIYRTLDTDLLASNRPIMANVAAVGITLDAGTYWLDFNFDGSLTSGPWAPPVTYLGLPGSGNALQYLPASGWVPLDDDLWQDDAPFIIMGSVGGDCNDNGIPDVCDVPPL
ncbi:MAG: hypothetical protein JSV19_07690, partial [Phycisphaerales bacterium]